MPRSARTALGGVVFHCLNRGNDRGEVFAKDSDYAAFEKVLAEVLKPVPMRLLAYCLMPNHWHLLLWPRLDGDLGRFMARVNRPQSAAEEQSLRLSLSRGRPFGDADWQAKTAVRLGLEKTFRPRGRPKTQVAASTDAADRTGGRTRK